MKKPSWNFAMRDYSVELEESVWIAVDGTPPPDRALERADLVKTGPLQGVESSRIGGVYGGPPLVDVFSYPSASESVGEASVRNPL